MQAGDGWNGNMDPKNGFLFDSPLIGKPFLSTIINEKYHVIKLLPVCFRQGLICMTAVHNPHKKKIVINDINE